MSRTDAIIQQIADLSPEERDIVYQDLKRRLDRVARAQEAIDRIKGKGAGVWGADAQDYINQQRADDRF